MDTTRNIQIAYAAMDLCNPVSIETIDRVLGLGALPKGARTLDLGCGNGAMSIHLAETFGFHVEAIERSPGMFEIARARAAGRGSPGRITLHNVDSKAYLGTVEPFDLMVCMGAGQLASDTNQPEAVLRALAGHIRPGGFLLLGDVFWRHPPEPAIAATVAQLMIGAEHSAYVWAGEAAGLSCRYAVASTEQDWDDYAWRIAAANAAWLEQHPHDPQAGQVRI